MAPTELVFNGIDGTSGGYLTPPLPPEVVAKIATGAPVPPEVLTELKQRKARKDEASWALIPTADPKDLASAGWGVIFPAKVDEGVRAALRPLLDHRKAQAGRAVEAFYQEYVFPDFRRDDRQRPGAFLPGDTKRTWLARNGATPGMPADPTKVPYYLLIVASPEVIPFDFQYQLDIEYAVGRLWFETPDGRPDLEAFAAYARSVIAAETGPPALPRRAAFFGVQNADDRATGLSAPHLVQPLAAWMATVRRVPSGELIHPGWEFPSLVGDGQATKETLARLLGGDQTPALLFTASHGLAFPTGDAKQIPCQGALLCQNWPGPREWGDRPPLDKHYFAADDVGGDARLLGLIAFHFACYGAGTPVQDDFPHYKDYFPRSYTAPRPILARLPQRLLGHPKGGALAVVGHVERAWSCSFYDAAFAPRFNDQLQAYQGTLSQLLQGYPLGAALEPFNQLHAALGADLGEIYQKQQAGYQPDPTELASMWTANNDARNFVILGDPAVRLAAVAPGAAAGPRPTLPPAVAVPPAPPTLTPAAPPAPAPAAVGAAPPPLARPVVEPPADERARRRQRLLIHLQGRPLHEAYLRPDIRPDLEAEAADPAPDQVITADQLALLREQIAAREAALRLEAGGPADFLFFSTDQVVLVPGFMGSELSDLAPGGAGLIWLSPAIAFRDRLSALRLAPYDGAERDAAAAVRVAATGALPAAYTLLLADLELRRYATTVHPVDWRKDLDLAADALANRLRGLAAAGKPIHVLAHSQGALVARRALQRLQATPGGDAVLERVRTLVLFGPANFGTFTAAFAIAGTHSLLPTLRRWAVVPPEGLQPTLASMTGLYQLLPWDADRVPWLRTNRLGDPAFWAGVPIDGERLKRFYGWGRGVDTRFFNDRTRVVLGGNGGQATCAGAAVVGGQLQPSGDGLAGDGTVPHACSLLPEVRTFLDPAAEHGQLGMTRAVIGAIHDLLAGRAPALPEVSSDPARHLAPQSFAAPAAAFALPFAAAAAGPAPARLPRPAATLDQILRAAADVAAGRRSRVRITIEVVPE